MTDLPVFGVVWVDPHGGIGSIPRKPDGSPDPVLSHGEAEFEGQVLADLSPEMVVMLIQESDIPSASA